MPKQVAEYYQNTAAKDLKDKSKEELEKDKLSRQQQKLLEAHYADTIPMELFKRRTAHIKIGDAISAIERRIQMQGDRTAAFKKYLFDQLKLPKMKLTAKEQCSQ